MSNGTARITGLQLNMTGVREVMASKGVVDVLKAKADEIATIATADAQALGKKYAEARYDPRADVHKRGIAAAHVWGGNLAAHAAEAKDHALSGAVAKIEV